MSPARELEFWFDFGSPYAYLAALRLERLAAARELRIAWRSFLLGAIFHAQGWSDSPFNLYPAKGRYLWRDLERCSARLGLPFRRPSVFPRKGLLAARIACFHAQAPWLPDFVRAVYCANFEQDLDIAGTPVIGLCLAAAGADAGPIIEAAQSPESKEALRAQTEEAIRRGIFGAPSFMAGSELFWGNDRLEAALDWSAPAA